MGLVSLKCKFLSKGKRQFARWTAKNSKAANWLLTKRAPAPKTVVVAAVADVAVAVDSVVDAAAAAAVETVTETVVVAAATVGSKK